MRGLIITFGLYLLTISVLPCGDSFISHLNNKESISLVHHHDHSSGTEDRCNPFCTCSCCSTVINLQFFSNPVKEQFSGFFKKQFFSFENLHLTSDFYGNIWQPPRLHV